MTYLVKADFRAKTGQGETELEEGRLITMNEARAERLVKVGKIEKLENCHTCHTFSWWISIHGVLVCGVCHPSARPDLVKRWIGDPECYTRLKASRSGGPPSIEDFIRRVT